MIDLVTVLVTLMMALGLMVLIPLLGVVLFTYGCFVVVYTLVKAVRNMK